MKRGYVLTFIVLIVLSGFWLENKYNLSIKINNIGTSPYDAFNNLIQILKKDGFVETIKRIRIKLSNDPRLGLNYSLEDPDSYPEVESLNKRESLPDEWILKRTIDINNLPDSNILGSEDISWYRSNGGDYSSKYSALDQILSLIHI